MLSLLVIYKLHGVYFYIWYKVRISLIIFAKRITNFPNTIYWIIYSLLYFEMLSLPYVKLSHRIKAASGVYFSVLHIRPFVHQYYKVLITKALEYVLISGKSGSSLLYLKKKKSLAILINFLFQINLKINSLNSI